MIQEFWIRFKDSNSESSKGSHPFHFFEISSVISFPFHTVDFAFDELGHNKFPQTSSIHLFKNVSIKIDSKRIEHPDCPTPTTSPDRKAPVDSTIQQKRGAGKWALSKFGNQYRQCNVTSHLAFPMYRAGTNEL